MNLYLIYISNKQQCRIKLQMNNKMITIDVVYIYYSNSYKIDKYAIIIIYIL
jgi:hypothetical protein